MLFFLSSFSDFTDSISGKIHRQSPKIKHQDVILIAAGSFLIVLLLLCGILCCCLIRKRAASKGKDGGPTDGGGAARAKKGLPPTAEEVEVVGDVGKKLVHFDGTIIFTADDLLCATIKIMGKSTYKTVYKATLEDGNQVAVKRLREKITKGRREFEMEVDLLDLCLSREVFSNGVRV